MGNTVDNNVSKWARALSAARLGTCFVVALSAFLGSAASTLTVGAAAAAQKPELLWEHTDPATRPEISSPGAVAADPTRGDVYVVNGNKNWVEKFDSFGRPTEAFGGGVVSPGATGLGDLVAGSARVQNFEITSKAFELEQEVEGPGIPAGTTVAKMGLRTLTLSKAARQSVSGAEITMPEGAGNEPTNERQIVTLPDAVTGGSFTLTFDGGHFLGSTEAGSNIVTGVGAQEIGATSDRASAWYTHGGSVRAGDELGQTVLEKGLPPGTTVTRVGEDELEITAPASESRTVGMSALETTIPIMFNAPSSAVAADLEALPAVGPGAVEVTGPAGGPYAIEFRGPRMGDFNLETLDADGGDLEPVGSVAVTTEQDGASSLEVCVTGDHCKEGILAEAAGRFGSPTKGSVLGGIAVDSSGNVFVGDLVNNRVEKFSPSGEFLLMFGKGVDKGPNHAGDVCTAAYVAAGEDCAAGAKGVGPGELDNELGGNHIAMGPGNTVEVGDRGRVLIFSDEGVFDSAVALPAGMSTDLVHSFDVGPTGRLYLTASKSISEPPLKEVIQLEPDASVVRTIGLQENPTALTVEPDGTIDLGIMYQANQNVFPVLEVIKFTESGEPLLAPGEGFAQLEVGGYFLEQGTVGGLASNIVDANGDSDVYVAISTRKQPKFAVVAGYGPAPSLWPPPAAPPEIDRQFASSVDATSASVRAEINPRYWADTTYSVEYGTGGCAQGGCSQTSPAAPKKLTSQVTSKAVVTEPVPLSGLQPGTVYHYRFISQSGGGGPVHGVGPDEAEGSFTTPRDGAESYASCSNDVYRTGSAARLPDCRGYEMVSPVDKNNTDIVGLINISSITAAFDAAASSGESFAYTTSQAFGDAKSAPYLSQYMATRGADGWSSRGISPEYGFSPVSVGQRIDLEYEAFTPDLCMGALVHPTDPVLAPGAVEGYVNLYKRRLCAGEGYEPLTTEPPADIASSIYVPHVEGLSKDGRCAVYSIEHLFVTCEDRSRRQVDVLPNGRSASGGSAGTANTGLPPRQGTNLGATSDDGSRIYWTEDEGGHLFVRINADQRASKISEGSCTEAAGACTLEVSQLVSGADAHYWAASPDGSRAIFSIGASLYEFELEGDHGSSHKIAGGFVGFLGAGNDAKRVTFASAEILTGENEEGQAPAAGSPNLYFYDADSGPGGRFRLIGVLADDDQVPNGYTPLASGLEGMPYRQDSRITPNGETVVFGSRAPLTGYDNTDQKTGAADSEVFVYQAFANGGSGRLLCVSCNPGGARPTGRIVPLENFEYSINSTSGAIPVYATELYGSRVATDDGSRVFFDSYEALVPRDTNQKADVYEWEESGTGSCTTVAVTYSRTAQGCVNLISSGESSSDSEFIDSSSDGRDVFFATAASLVDQDPGLIDIYDAREGGGFPPLPAGTAGCEGEACQGPVSRPNDATPASSSYQGPGNIQRPKARKCTKPKVKGKAAKKPGKKGCTKKPGKKTKRNEAKKHKSGKRTAGKDRGGKR